MIRKRKAQYPHWLCAVLLLCIFHTHTDAQTSSFTNENAWQNLKSALEKEGYIPLEATIITTVYRNNLPDTIKSMVKWNGKGAKLIHYISGTETRFTILQTDDTIWSLGNKKQRRTCKKITSIDQPGKILHFDLLQKNYTIRIDEKTVVAKRDTYLFEINPTNSGNPYLKLWIDCERGIILKREYYDHESKLKSYTEITGVDFSPNIDPVDFTLPDTVLNKAGIHQNTEIDSIQQLSNIVGFNVHKPVKLPPGYILTGYFVYRCSKGVSSALLRFSDGLNSFSLIQRYAVCPACGHKPQGFGFGKGRGKGKQAGAPL